MCYTHTCVPAIIFIDIIDILYYTQLPVHVNTDPICLLYRVFHETQTAMAMAVVVTMVATVVGAVVHAVKVRISVPSLLFCIFPNVLYFVSRNPLSKFTFISSIIFHHHYFTSYVCLCLSFIIISLYFL